MSETSTHKKERAVLDSFQLFYEELPQTLADTKRSTRLQRRSKQ